MFKKSNLFLHVEILKKVKVNSGFYKGLCSTEYKEKNNSYEIFTTKGSVIVHKNRCEIIEE